MGLFNNGQPLSPEQIAAAQAWAEGKTPAEIAQGAYENGYSSSQVDQVFTPGTAAYYNYSEPTGMLSGNVTVNGISMTPAQVAGYQAQQSDVNRTAPTVGSTGSTGSTAIPASVQQSMNKAIGPVISDNARIAGMSADDRVSMGQGNMGNGPDQKTWFTKNADGTVSRVMWKEGEAEPSVKATLTIWKH